MAGKCKPNEIHAAKRPRSLGVAREPAANADGKIRSSDTIGKKDANRPRDREN